jgi:disulfide bond formation protein DsbB
MPSTRQIFLILFLGCVGLMSFGYYLQYVENLEPCPLCMTQRLFFVLSGILGLAAFLHNPGATGMRIYGVLTAVAAASGAGFASRQLWLQSLPEDQVPACGPSLEYMFDALPFMEAFELLLKGDGNCAEVVWDLFGISIPGWSLIAFIGILVLAAYQIITSGKNQAA